MFTRLVGLPESVPNDAIPVIGDANSLTYVLHLKVGDEMVIDHASGPLRLLIVGALADSIFQSELLMSERNFLRKPVGYLAGGSGRRVIIPPV